MYYVRERLLFFETIKTAPLPCVEALLFEYIGDPDARLELDGIAYVIQYLDFIGSAITVSLLLRVWTVPSTSMPFGMPSCTDHSLGFFSGSLEYRQQRPEHLQPILNISRDVLLFLGCFLRYGDLR